MQFCHRDEACSGLAVIAALLALFAVSSTDAAAHVRRHRSSAAVSRAAIGRHAPSLPSRGLTDTRDPAVPAAATCQLGVVTDDNVPINAGREQYGRLLSRVSKGTNLTIYGQEGDFYAVVMIDHSIGFIAKSSVQLLDYKYATDVNTSIGASGPKGQAMVQFAMDYLKVVPYRWGGTTMSGIDCSGFVRAVYESQNLRLPRTAAEQAVVGYDVPLRELTQWQVGDRMYFQCHHGYIDHTGMYIGAGYFIHSHVGAGVSVTRVVDPYYWQHLVAVRRSPEMLDDARTAGAQTSSPDMESSQAQ